MKKVLFLTFMLLSLSVWAGKPHRVYCELYTIKKLFSTNKMSVYVIIGDDTKSIADEQGKSMVFNSIVPALNYMSQRGWHFEQSYVSDVLSNNIRRWLLSKMITDEAQIKEGLNFVRKKKKK